MEPLHDRDRIVTFLTREYGKKRGVARGARVKHSRFGGQLQPLANFGLANGLRKHCIRRPDDCEKDRLRKLLYNQRARPAPVG